MRIALAQLNTTVGALRENTEKIKEHCRNAQAGGADLIIFTELVITGYPPKDLLLYSSFIERERAMVTEELLPLTLECGLKILIGTTHLHSNKLYNAALLLEQGEIKSVHMKTLLPNYDTFDEQRYFESHSERKVELIGGIPTAITICEDIWNDKELCGSPLCDTNPLESLFAQGARLLINISASPYHLGKHALRENMLSFLAQKYNAGVIYLNQVGGNDELIFDGSSLIYNYRGELLYRAAAFEEELFYVETDNLFSPRVNFISSDVDNISSVMQALKLGLKDYVSKTGFKKTTLGLSGGIDSAVVAVLAVEALGTDNVLGILMPSPYSSDHSLEDAKTLAENLGITYRTIAIGEPFNAYLKLLNPDRVPLQDLAEENLQARIRGNLVMHISNREGYLALTTGNKSELAVGYCTLYGDMSGGLAVLADLPKMMVYELAHYLNQIYGWKIIPDRTITKAPSAELRPNQKDEDSLPPYHILDPILHLYIEKNLSQDEMIQQGYPEETVFQIIRMVDRAEFKRHQAAPGLRITTRTFGSGRRMPIARRFDY
ncbi:MAG TPA: NAD+ synthase [Candidatus Limnocylindrales bacterium]|nr:NAD+ synthase [Candidatus Limnocylindrales bacterium]